MATAHTVDATRITRASIAIAGLVQVVSKSPALRTAMGSRAGVFAMALHMGRGTTAGFDAATGLYYTVTVNLDGSGQQLLFTDASHTVPAGFVRWGIPTWTNGKPGLYPAVFHATYQLTRGEFAGCSGTLDVTLDNAAETQGIIDIILQDKKHDHCHGHYVINGGLSGDCGGTFPDGSTCSGTCNENGDVIQTVIVINDGGDVVIDENGDGSGTETYTDASGNDSSGTFTDTGVDTINYTDGSSDTVDTSTSSDGSSSDGSGDSSGSSDGGASPDVSGDGGGS